ncbi:MAG: dTDP-4-dehydrorhamnose 3,5-epimerase [Candidatus Altiarchaeales archaeon HGW-Altiarchaeales-2]|nr:MAG: dTDP-4-dehydrorhamnose 3,5-epimerase [Candidatus Altiarchaeales archaeon HGW-Altiarchaeales-2]
MSSYVDENKIIKTKIDGVVIKPLKKIVDERGCVMHMLRMDDQLFEHFGEIYFSTAYPGVIKGWHLHKKMTLNYAVVSGMIKMVLYDDRQDSKTKGELLEVFIGEDNYCLLKIPPLIWNGFKVVGTKPAIVANCATMPHEAGEIIRMDPINNDKIIYKWDITHG